VVFIISLAKFIEDLKTTIYNNFHLVEICEIPEYLVNFMAFVGKEVHAPLHKSI
jgi:hypothetical protein